MKTLTLLVPAFLLGCHGLSAQSSEKIRVKSGNNATEVLSAGPRFMYPDFLKGQVYFQDGRSSAARLNYDLRFEEVEFISPAGDTLALANPEKIKYIAIGENRFYYDEGYLEELASYKDVKLLVKRKLKVADREKIGGYGQPSGVSAIGSYSSYTVNNKVYNLTVREDLIMSRNASFYLMDQTRHFRPVTRGNILRTFARYKGTIQKYLSENDPDLRKAEDIKKLLEFCSRLP